MITKIEVTNHLGESIELELRSPEKSGFFVLGIDGLGPTKGTINLTEVLSIDGAIYNSGRKTFRNIIFNLKFREDSTHSIEDIRQLSYKYFPTKKRISLVITTDSRVCVTEGYVESNEISIFDKQQGAMISVVCPNAYFSSEEEIDVDFIHETTPLFEFPFENPSITLPLINFGDIVHEMVKEVTNAGDVETGIVFIATFLDSASGFYIFNNTYEEVITIDSDIIVSLTGSDFIAGDVLLISTLQGSKYVYLYRDAELINVFNAFDLTSDWITLRPGVNEIEFGAESGGDFILFSINYAAIYEGV